MIRIRHLCALAALASLTAFQTAMAQTTEQSTVTAEQKTAVLQDMEGIITRRAYVPGVDFSKWPDLVKRHQAKIDEAKDQFAFTTVMNQALQEFGFSHIVLFSPQAASARTSRKTVGLGVRISPEPKGLRIVFVFPGTPADEAGIKEGDLIVGHDGQPVKSTNDLQGEEGTKVTVTVERAKKTLDFEITRKAFSTDLPQTLKWVTSDTAVLTVPTFDLGYKDYQISDLMADAMKAKNLVVDLRGNGGGQVINLMHLVNFFLPPDKPIGTFVNRVMADSYAKETGKPGTDPVAIAAWTDDKLHSKRQRAEYFTGKVAVLINGGTGSASEMFAAAMKENRNARLIGQKSAGAVLASLMWPIKEKFLLQFPLMDYVTIKGMRLEGNGLKPDKEAPNPAPGQADKAITLAQAWFKKG